MVLLDLDRAAAISAIRISGMIKPAEEDEVAASSAISVSVMIGTAIPPAKAAVAATAATAPRMMDLNILNLKKSIVRMRCFDR